MGKTLEAHIADVKAVRSGHGSELAAVVSRIDSLEKLVAASADSTTTSSTDTTKIQEELTALSTGLQTLVDRVSGIAASSDERFVSLEGKVISLTEQATGQVVQSSELSEEELDRIVVFVRKSIDIQGFVFL
jgi:ethanolamine ammonia-lyase large subunit